VEKLVARLRGRGAAPLIVELQEQLESVRRAEVDRVRAKLGTLTPEQEAAVEAMTRAMMAKVAHGPIAEMRRLAGADDGWALMDAVRRMFRLERKEQ
jgi:glutamyl-tRNA reductase